jgi:signal transduction histidine kinase
VLNLLSNACKFTHNGEVCFNVDSFHDSIGWWIRFTVKDTGIGTAPSEFKTLLCEFTQVRQDGRTYGGTGLGLAISHRLCHIIGAR